MRNFRKPNPIYQTKNVTRIFGLPKFKYKHYQLSYVKTEHKNYTSKGNS